MSVDLRQSTTAPSTVPDTAPPASWFYRPKFASPDLLFAVRDFLPAQGAWEGGEGPVARFSYSPGAVAVNRRNYARREKSTERAVQHHGATVEQLAAQFLETGKFPDRPTPRQEITGWSRKSRSNFTRAMCDLDYVGGIQPRAGLRRQPRPVAPLLRRGRAPVMLTLTYSGDWLPVAPNGKAAKRHLSAFFRAYQRAWGEPLACVWKLEFQRRGAPHYHLFMVPPAGRARAGAGLGQRFKAWLSDMWARIVAHPDEEERERHRRVGTRIDSKDGLRATDPKRVAVYFLKHGSFRAKEYQHIVPDQWQGPGDGPGRFWGYRHLRRLVHGVEVSPADATVIARTLRRWDHAKGVTQQRVKPRYVGGRPLQAYPDVRGLAGLQYAEERPVLARAASGELRWESAPVVHKHRRRATRQRAVRMRGGAGWVAVNDGAAYASQIARYLERRYGSAREELLATSDIARRVTPEERERLAALRARWLYRPPP